jgi:molybdopterin synthase catalytic subunit
MSILLKATRFDPYTEVQRFEQTAFVTRGAFGATALFVGTMRDYNEGAAVRGLTLEHYPGMTERHLEDICIDARRRWALLETLVVHRVGDVSPGEHIVLVAVWSAHRAEAFEACRYIMEDLKSKAPFWKKEATDSGSRWVAHNTPGTTHSD